VNAKILVNRTLRYVAVCEVQRASSNCKKRDSCTLNNSDFTMSADSLSGSTRMFYENVRGKMVASIFLAAMAMMSLAYVSSYGGASNSANFLKKFYHDRDNINDDEQENAQGALAGGYGRTIDVFA
jgi:hypothetical protein